MVHCDEGEPIGDALVLVYEDTHGERRLRSWDLTGQDGRYAIPLDGGGQFEIALFVGGYGGQVGISRDAELSEEDLFLPVTVEVPVQLDLHFGAGC